MLGLGSGWLYSYFDTEIYPKQAGTLAFENHVMILLGLKIHSSHIHSVYTDKELKVRECRKIIGKYSI